MLLDEIGFYTLTEDRVSCSSIYTPLWRCELILTDRCNFKCPYCRGLKDDCKKDLSLEEAARIISYWGKEHLKNIRFSGGEPTLYPYLKQLVVLASNKGIERIALSTNGSASLELYKELIDLGVNDFSISLDACCSNFGEEMAGGVKIVWENIVSNIRELSKLTYVTVGIVLTEKNIKDAKDIISFAHSLGVGDIRVIPAAQYSESFKVLNEIDDILSHRILHYRVNNYKKGRDIRGLTISDNSQCPLVLDDMAISGKYHFPCIIYMREHGDPIGTTENLNKIRPDREGWFKTHNTQTDKICRKNCLDVCRDFNNKWKMYADR